MTNRLVTLANNIAAPIKSASLVVAEKYKDASASVKRRHLKYLDWANSPYTTPAIAGPGPDAKWLVKFFDVLYENRFSKWLAGK